MLKIFYGDDRGRIGTEVKKELGEGYEVFEGEEIQTGDLHSIFFGLSLLSGAGGRRILIRDLGANKEAFTELSEGIEGFLLSDAKIIILESKLDKRTVVVKNLAKAGVEIKELKVKAENDPKAVFGIYDLAMRDGGKAVKEVEKIEGEQDPFMFFGLLATQALKRLEWRPTGRKERRVVKELAEIDKKMKSTGVEPWILIKCFLVRLSSL